MPAVPCSTDGLIIGPFNLCLNGVDLGATTGGVSITQNREYTEIRNDQSKTLQAIATVTQDFMVTVTMRDLTLDKLRVLYGVREGLAADGQSLCVVDNATECSFPEEFTLTVAGPGPGCGYRSFHFPRVVITPATVEILIQRDNPAEVAVEFKVLAACPGGQLMCVTDVADKIAVAADGADPDTHTFSDTQCADTPIPDFVTTTTTAAP